MKRIPLLIIFLTVFIDLVGFGMVFPLLPLYMEQFGISYLRIGIVFGSYSLMQFFFSPLLGRLSDRIGRRPVLCVSLLGTALSFFWLGLAHNFWMFLLARMLDGISGSNIATAQAYVADVSKPEDRTKAIGMVIGMAFGLGFAFGPFLGGILGEFGLSFPYFVAGGMALMNAIWAWFRLPESLHLRKEAHAIGFRTFSPRAFQQAFRSRAASWFAIYAISILAFAMMEASFSILGSAHFQLGRQAIYWVFAYIGIIITVVQGGLIRPLVKRFGEGKLVVLGAALMAVSLAGLPLFATTAWLLVLIAILSIGNGLANPSILGLISLTSSTDEQGMALGIAQSLASLARFIGPLIGDGLLHGGFQLPYTVSGLIMGVALLITIPLVRRQGV